MPFDLVQRLEAAPDGVCHNPLNGEAPLRVSKFLLEAGGEVDLAFMGRAEFEDSLTLVGSANRIASAARKLKVIEREIEVPRYSGNVHFVCADDQTDETLREWEAWAQSPECATATGFFEGEDPDYAKGVVGWWALGEDLIWTEQATVAEKIRKAFVAILDKAS